ncbi:MAG: hypothetical protein ABI354_01885, partial [Candidatus Saccharimonadales bacterium]
PAKTALETPKQPKNGTRDLSKEDWQNVLDAIKSDHNTLYGIARMASASFENQTITLAFGFPFHQKRLNDTKNKQLLLDIIFEITGVNANLECIVSKPTKAKVSTPKPEISVDEPDDIQAISNIFGAAEVLE